MSKKRKYCSPEEKVCLLKEHLVNGNSLSMAQPLFKAIRITKLLALKSGLRNWKKKSLKNEVLGELMEEYVALKSLGGGLNKRRVSQKVCEQVVDFVHEWTSETRASQRQLLKWIGIGASKFHDWERRYEQDDLRLVEGAY